MRFVCQSHLSYKLRHGHDLHLTSMGDPPRGGNRAASFGGLLIDANDTDRVFYAKELRRWSRDYRILEATSGQSGLDLYRQSSKIDCVVLEPALPDGSGFAVLMDLFPIPSRPNVAVVVLTQVGYDGWWILSKQIGAHAVLFKPHTSGKDLDRAIQQAITSVGLLPKEDRPKPI